MNPYLKYTNGGPIDPKNKVTIDGKEYDINSPEYRKLYKEGISSVDSEGMPNYYSQETAVVTGKAPDWLKVKRGEMTKGMAMSKAAWNEMGNEALEMSGLAGAGRFMKNPYENLKGAYNTAMAYTSPYMGMFSDYNPDEDPQKFWNTVDAAGLATAVAAPVMPMVSKYAPKAMDYLSKNRIPEELGNVNTFGFTGNKTNPFIINEQPGLHIKSTMSGSPFEKQLSKTGELNTNNIISYLNKSDVGNQDKFIIQKVLDEKFSGQNKINYNDFRKAVSDELVPLDIVPINNHQYDNYGVKRIGFSKLKPSSYESAIKTINQDDEYYKIMKGFNKNEAEKITENGITKYVVPGRFITPGKLKAKPELIDENKIDRYLEIINRESEDFYSRTYPKKSEYEEILKTTPNTEVITYENPKMFGHGDDKHDLRKSTLGHSRLMTSKEEPNVMHVLEQQSDYWQNLGNKKTIDINKAKERISRQEKEYSESLNLLEYMKENKKTLLGDEVNDYQIKQFEELTNAKGEKLTLDKGSLSNPFQKEFLGKAYNERFLQENVLYASQKGMSKVRYPEKETARKIQGYLSEREGLALKERMDAYKRFIDDFEENSMHLYGKDDMLPSSYTQHKKDYELAKINYDQHEKNMGILRKYNEFPKTIKKVFGKEPTLITDTKGNTWYEFDIPESYKKGKAEIKAFSINPFIGTGSAGAAGAGYLGQKGQSYRNGGITNTYLKYTNGGPIDPKKKKEPEMTYSWGTGSYTPQTTQVANTTGSGHNQTMPSVGTFKGDYNNNMPGNELLQAGNKAIGQYLVQPAIELMNTPFATFAEGINAIQGKEYDFNRALPNPTRMALNAEGMTDIIPQQQFLSDYLGVDREKNPYLSIGLDVLTPGPTMFTKPLSAVTGIGKTTGNAIKYAPKATMMQRAIDNPVSFFKNEVNPVVGSIDENLGFKFVDQTIDAQKAMQKSGEEVYESSINLKRKEPKPKKTKYTYIENVEDPKFKIKKVLHSSDPEIPLSIEIRGESGKWKLKKNRFDETGDPNTWHFQAQMTNPVESGKALLKMDKLFPKPKPKILEPSSSSLSMDSYPIVLKMGNRKHWSAKHYGYIDMNDQAIHNTFYDDILTKDSEYATKINHSITEDQANTVLEKINKMIEKNGYKEKAKWVKNDDGTIKFKLPNYLLERDYSLGGEVNPYLKARSGIHIKPENRGKFTAWANERDMGVQEAANKVMANKDKYSSSVVKMANFAKNAAGWNKHRDGGPVDPKTGITMTKLTPDEEATYQEWVKSLTPNLKESANDENFDMRGAWKTGIQPELFYYDENNKFQSAHPIDVNKQGSIYEPHLFSRNPYTGKYLKGPYHETQQYAMEGDIKSGYTPFIDIKTGDWYSKQMANGGMIKRADGSYSQRGLWDNIRANKGSGKKPTQQMLDQEKKIKNEMEKGGESKGATIEVEANERIYDPKGNLVLEIPEDAPKHEDGGVILENVPEGYLVFPQKYFNELDMASTLPQFKKITNKMLKNANAAYERGEPYSSGGKKQ